MKNTVLVLTSILLSLTLLVSCGGEVVQEPLEQTEVVEEIEAATQQLEPMSILFVGNSFVFFGSLTGQLQDILYVNGIDITYMDISVGGATLTSHAENAKYQMRARQFDFVVLQDQSQRPLNDLDGFLNDVSRLGAVAEETGATLVLYNPAWPNIDLIPDEETQNLLTAAYMRAAEENNAILVNAGDAWVFAYGLRPDLDLYHEDAFHANYDGAFFTAAVFAATLYDIEFTNVPQYEDASIELLEDLVQIAWDFVNR